MASIFEKTMAACRESKANAAKKSNAKSKALTEKFNAKRIKKESEEDDEDFDDEIMLDVQDDIVAVIDPDIDADEMTSVAMGFQQLVDDATANEIPETDEYIDQEIYACPVCGQKFFSPEPMIGSGTCPVCGKEADGFVLVGEVDEAEGTSDEDEEKADSDEEKIDISDDGEDLDIEIKGEPEEEGKRVSKRETRKPIRRAVRREGSKARRITRRPGMAGESVKRGVHGMNLDEKTFNVYLNKFIRENYDNASSFRVMGAKMNNNNLTLECVIRFKSGKSKKVNLECKYDRKSKFMLARDNGAFKAESKKAPFMFKVRTVGNVIRCEGMRYDFTTTQKIKNESKKARVHGSYVNESRRVRKPLARRTVESRRRIARKPMARRMESRRIVRRPSIRRTVESRRAIRRPVSRRVSESRRLATRRMVRPSRVAEATRRTVKPMRAESSRIRRATRTVRSERIRRPVARKSVRSEAIRRRTAARRPMRSESRIARRNAITRRTAR